MAGFRSTWFWGVLMVPWGVLTVLLDAVVILLLAPFLGGKRAFFTIGPLWARQLFWVGGVRAARSRAGTTCPRTSARRSSL